MKKFLAFLAALIITVTTCVFFAGCPLDNTTNSGNENSNVETDDEDTNSDNENNDNEDSNADSDNEDSEDSDADNGNEETDETVSIVGTYKSYVQMQGGEIIDVVTEDQAVKLTLNEDGAGEMGNEYSSFPLSWIIDEDKIALTIINGDTTIDMTATIDGDCLYMYNPYDDQNVMVFKKVPDTPITTADIAGLYEYFAHIVDDELYTNDDYADDIILLNADGTGKYNYNHDSVYNCYQDIEWTLSENKITCTGFVKEYYSYIIDEELSINGEFLFLKIDYKYFYRYIIYKKVPDYTSIDKESVVGTYNYYATDADTLEFEDSESYLILNADGTGEYKVLIRYFNYVDDDYTTDYFTCYITWELYVNEIQIVGYYDGYGIFVSFKIDGDLLYVFGSYGHGENSGYIYLKQSA